MTVGWIRSKLSILVPCLVYCFCLLTRSYTRLRWVGGSGRDRSFALFTSQFIFIFVFIYLFIIFYVFSWWIFFFFNLLKQSMFPLEMMIILFIFLMFDKKLKFEISFKRVSSETGTILFVPALVQRPLSHPRPCTV